ncbi:hypothetical protein IV500_15405 [Paeniglutamicibacter antarcticus]|uniref:Uncharacterized protein n=1 Tax=Arthrobacter terrae TaxID=2935737 RepID=A0A931CTR4_9MICC|nr:hypothetical protein [Arthrobacter terrae]MBG0740761.1 hypothetical protein [Arthrobacter terrae]
MVFTGRIAGLGTTSGLRAVVGMWAQSPFGPFADVMVEMRSGHRMLLAPSAEIADFVSSTYGFDETLLVPVTASLDAWNETKILVVEAGPLRIRADVGARSILGYAAALLPRRLAVHPGWLRAVSPVAARLSPGVRTAGSAQDGRREFYGVTDIWRIDSAVVSWDGCDAGGLAQIRPPVRFGFSSVPSRPSVATVQTTVLMEQS